MGDKNGKRELVKVHAAVKYGFGGDDMVYIAVEEETDTRFRGHRVRPHESKSLGEMTVVKQNVAGWERCGTWPRESE